jgi:DNA polymerase-1
VNFDPKKTVFLIDGSSFLYRAYYSMRPLHTAKGVPVQAVYGFCRMIKKLMDKFDPAYMALVWDSKGKTVRHEMYPEYKATRQAAPSDLFEQKEFIIRFANDIGLKQIQQQGIEADDLMYSVAKERSAEGATVVLITSDKDMAQALNDTTVIYDTFKEKIIDRAAFFAEKGFPADRLVVYFALVGDASDNIPGVKGVGKTSALELVQQFATLDELYANINAVKNSRAKVALQVHKDDAYLSEKLFTLRYYPSDLSQQDLAFDMRNWAQARPLFEELGFKSMLQGLGGVASTAVASTPVLPQYEFKKVVTAEQLRDLCALLTTSDAFAMDTETTGLRPLQDPCVGMSFCVRQGLAYYVPFGHNVMEQQLGREEVIAALKPILESDSIKKYLHNVKFDQLVLWAAGIKLAGVSFDTMIAANLLTPEWQRVGLKALSEHYFQETMLSYDAIVKANKYKNFSYVPLDMATQYAAADAHQTLKLYHVLAPQLAKESKLQELFMGIEMPLTQVLFAMEARGIHCDATVLRELDKAVTQRLRSIEEEIALQSGSLPGVINLNSPKQVQALLFGTLMLPTQKKSAKGGYSTDVEVLEVLAKLHPVPKLIMQYRELAKLKSTYIDALPQYINPHTHNIHTTYNQVGVATGRLASSDPNLQNIPASGYGIEVRAAFKPQAGHLFLSADYSQIELRVLAHMSGDTNLINAFLQGRDIHAQTAAHLFDTQLEQVTHEQRQVGKRINFSILYGLTPYGLAKDLNISFQEAKTYIDKYFAQYPGVSRWMEQTIQECKERGYVETLWGRRRYIPAIHEKNKALYEEACRVAINTRAQGTAAEVMKQGMITLQQKLQAQNFEAYMLLQIHDELLMSVLEDQSKQVEALVKDVLEHVVTWKVPLQVSTRFGADWKEVTK